MRVMLVHDRAIDQLSPALLAGDYQVVDAVRPHEALPARVEQCDPDLLVFDVKCADAALLGQLQELNRARPRPIVIFTDDAESTAIQAAIEAGVSAYIVDGLHVKRLKPVLNVALARFQKMQKLHSELEDTRRTLSERKLIDRAKGILMQRRGISEDEAYHSLRKLAMQRNQRIGEVADSVISAAELLG